jgi:hypothetical protein
MSIVVGIFPDHGAVSKLVDALKTAGLNPADLTVISGDEAPEPLISSGVQFVLSGEAEESTLAGGVGIITSEGPDVPGMDEVNADVGALEEPPELEALSDLGVPDGRTDDYTEALEHGRSVAGLSTGDPDKAKGLFSSAGASTVEVY